MAHIAIISSSIRTGRKSHRVSLYFKKFIETNASGTAEIIDLKEYEFPLFEERLSFLEDPGDDIKDFTGRINKAEGIIIVTPEYNGGYPASLKNVIDLLNKEWRRKPIAIATVSAGDFAGTQALVSLQFTLWKIGAWVVPAKFQVPNIEQAFNDEGIPTDWAATEKRAKTFLDELLWCVKATEHMTMQEAKH